MISLKDKEKYGPVVALAAICLIIFLFVWKFALSEPPIDTVPRAVIKRAPEIDFNYLKSSEVNYFKEYEKIDPLEEDLMGREEPFSSY